MTENDTMLSRSGNSSTDGKKTSRIDIPVSEELESEIIALATFAKLPKAEWARRVLERAVHGELGMLRRIADGGGIRQSDECGR